MLNINTLHGSVINYEDIKNIPPRNMFLENKCFTDTDNTIASGKPLMFMPNALHEMHLQEKKYDPALYSIVLFGIFIDGRRATVVINGIKPYFEVLIPIQKDNSERELAMDLYNKLKNTQYTVPDRMEILSGKKFKGYEKKSRTFARFYFNKLKPRTDAIKLVKSQGYDTTADDTSCYYRVLCRDKLTTFSSWINISEYTIKTYTNIRGNVFSVNIKNYNKYTDNILDDIKLAKDNTMTMCWDIETYSPDGQLPVPDNPDHKMFMLSTTFQWYHSNDQLLRVCLVDHPCDARPNYLTVVCDTEKKLIKAFGKIVNKMKPEMHIGFNDSDYDWPWLIKRAKSYPGTLVFLAECFDCTRHWKNYDDESILSYNFKKEKIKLEADMYADGYSLVFPGYINIDVRTIFRQLYPTAEKSNLNFYLSLNKLGGKKDVPYQEIFNIYKNMTDAVNRRNAIAALLPASNQNILNIILNYESSDYITLKDKMADVADYCVIDSQRCHELMKIRSVVMDRREVSNLSYTSIFDAFYRANGMKVRNLVIARGQTRGIKFSNITNNENIDDGGKYPGAYVLPPKKGLVTSKLTIQERIDNSKLDIYNDWSDVTADELLIYYEFINSNGSHKNETDIAELIASRAQSGLPPLKKCFIEFLTELTYRPITGLDFSSLYPSLIMAYNLSPEFIITNVDEARTAQKNGHNLYKIKFMYNGKWVRAWAIRHDNNLNTEDTNCKFGVYPMILKELFDSRNTMKHDLHKWESSKERIESMPKEEFMKPEIQAEYETVCFNFNYMDSKQKALKVFMNTFYGESGNKRSPFFILQLAGAITAAGKDNIKMVQKFIEEIGCDVYYGDTDSIYSAIPDKYFNEIDRQYYSNNLTKLNYWNEMVNITFREISTITKLVNDMLILDNGSKFLKMAYEEALFPVVFLAKKKYYGIPHISVPNFNPKQLFIKGLEVKKRGVSEFLRKICMNIMWDSMSLTNIYTLLELVKHKIDTIYTSEWDFNDFVMTDMFKPTKQNVKVQTFVKRMLSEGIAVKPYERFQYVIVKKNPYKYDERGRKKELSIGEKMEYFEVANEKKLSIDMDYYMKGSINGQLARLITYLEIFHVNPVSSSADDLKTADDKIYNNACKYIETYCDKYYAKYENNGKIYQKIFRMANSIITEKVKEYYGNETMALLGSNYDIENLEEWLDTKATKEAISLNKGYGKQYIDRTLSTIIDDSKAHKLKELQDIYFARKSGSISQMRETAFNDRRSLLTRQIRDNINKIVSILNHHTHMVGKLQTYIKDSLNLNMSNPIAYDVSILKEFETKNNSIELNNMASIEINNLFENSKLSESLTTLKYIYINMVSNHSFIQKTRLIVDYLQYCKNKSIGLAPKPVDFSIKTHISLNVDEILLEIKNQNI